MVSRVNSLRDHRTLCKAFLKVNQPKSELHLAGDGPLLQELKSEFSDSRIIWHGLLDHQEIVALLGSLDIYFHASLGETSSISMMEARASGLPLIASNVEGIANVVDAKNGILVDPKNIDSYSDKLRLLINDPKKRKELGEASLAYALNHLDNKKMFNTFKEIIL